MPSYVETTLKYAFENCKECQNNCENKSICLICGKVLCVNSKKCNLYSSIQIGNEQINDEAIEHSILRHDGESYFFRIYHATIISISYPYNASIFKIYSNGSGEDLANHIARSLIIDSSELKDYFLNINSVEFLVESILRCGIRRNLIKLLLKEDGIPFIN